MCRNDSGVRTRTADGPVGILSGKKSGKNKEILKKPENELAFFPKHI